jgi:hypothetical protein
MKTRKRTTVPSMIRPTHKFTERERQAYLEWQKPDANAPADYLTIQEAGDLITDFLDGEVSHHSQLHGSALITERKGQVEGRMLSPLRVALAIAASMVFDDNGETVDDETNNKIEEVCDAVESCWLDPEPPKSWWVTTTPESDGRIDVPKFIAEVRADAAALVASRAERKPQTLDEHYRVLFEDSGRANADGALKGLRALGALGTLRVTKGITHVVDRAGYDKLLRGIGRPFYCHDPYCAGETTHYTWDELSEYAEDGKLAVHVRRQERRDGTWVTAIAVCGRPTGITEGLAKMDEKRQYIVVESEVAA